MFLKQSYCCKKVSCTERFATLPMFLKQSSCCNSHCCFWNNTLVVKRDCTLSNLDRTACEVVDLKRKKITDRCVARPIKIWEKLTVIRRIVVAASATSATWHASKWRLACRTLSNTLSKQRLCFRNKCGVAIVYDGSSFATKRSLKIFLQHDICYKYFPQHNFCYKYFYNSICVGNIPAASPMIFVAENISITNSVVNKIL